MVTTLEQHRAWKKANPGKVKAYREKHQPVQQAKKYDLTVAQVQLLIEAQNGLCGICAKVLTPWPDVRTHVDHDHETGKVRGVLCSSCNRYEGWVRRNGAKLQQYLDSPPAAFVLEVL